MNVLVIGQGGREHALVKALKTSKVVKQIHVVPGSDGMAQEAHCHFAISANDKFAIVNLCRDFQIHYVIIGPEDPLVAGLADFLRASGIPTLGPSEAAAHLEGSKVFAKDFMREFGVATSKFVTVTSVQEALNAATQFTPPYVLKADGLCAGKGVSICQTLDQLKNAAEQLFEKKVFGAAGERAVMEQFLPGYELSLLVLTNGTDYELLPMAQDHKQLLDGDSGPNTGGMGTVAPIPIDESLRQSILNQIVRPTINGLNQRKYLYRGVIFFGIMVTQSGPMCLEYNVRFGDPETQVILPLLNGDWGEVFYSLTKGVLHLLKWNDKHTCCVVLAAPGYPEAPQKGIEITGDLSTYDEHSYFLHAGSRLENNKKWLTHGGRVLCAVGVGKSKNNAKNLAYHQARHAHWQGLQMRMDIGQRELKI